MSCTHSFRKIISTHRWKTEKDLMTYRFKCKSCGHKWIVYYKKDTEKEIPVYELDSKRISRFSADEIKQVLLDTRANGEIAKYWGVSTQAIQQVKTGKSYKHIHPEIPRKESKPIPILSCKHCKFWGNNSCSLDFPEAGGGFADECAYYEKEC